jgi:S1-C subfamily serine protease
MSLQSSNGWTCPQCQRRVPGRVQQCRCGFEYIPAAEPSSTAEPAPPVRRSVSRALFVPLLIGVGVLAGIYIARSSNTPENTAAAQSSPRVRPATPVVSAESAPTEPVSAPRRLSPPPSETIEPSAAPPASMPAAGRTRSIEEIVGEAEPAVALIETSAGRGTGFFIGPDMVLTNVHVVAGQAGVTVKLNNGVALGARVERQLPDVDIALVRTNAPHPHRAALEMGSAAGVRAGQEVIAIGSPLGLQNTVTRGIVSAVRNADGVVLIQTDAAINPGNSGGPLLDRNGRVIGITTLRMGGVAQSLGFAVAINHAQALISGRADAVVSSPSRSGGMPSIALPSESDSQRNAGETEYERQMQALARAADQLDGSWKNFQKNCSLNSFSTGDAQREWFAMRDQPPTFKAADVWCGGYLQDLLNRVADYSRAMAQSGEQARRAGVYPGALREIRRRYRVDWTGWDR